MVKAANVMNTVNIEITTTNIGTKNEDRKPKRGVRGEKVLNERFELQHD
jgi:polyisoprenoid-binding protein YceI